MTEIGIGDDLILPQKIKRGDNYFEYLPDELLQTHLVDDIVTQ